MDNKKHIEAIEASRVDSSDLADFFPETAEAIGNDGKLRRFANRVQNADRGIAETMNRVEPPDGLKERLLASIAAIDADSKNLNSPSEITPAERNLFSSSRLGRLSSRQWAALSVSLTASAACIVVAAIFALGGSPDNEFESAVASFEALAPDEINANWEAPQTPFKLPKALHRPAWANQPIQTQTVRTRNYGKVTLAKLSNSATLLIAIGNSRSLPAHPLVQNGGTGKYRYTAWSSDGFTYLLAVANGEPDDYVKEAETFVMHATPAAGGELSSIGTTVTDSNWLSIV